MQLNIKHLATTILFLSLRHVTSLLELLEIDKDTSSQKYLRSSESLQTLITVIDNYLQTIATIKKKENSIFNLGI